MTHPSQPRVGTKETLPQSPWAQVRGVIAELGWASLPSTCRDERSERGRTCGKGRADAASSELSVNRAPRLDLKKRVLTVRKARRRSVTEPVRLN